MINQQEPADTLTHQDTPATKYTWVFDVLLIFVLLAGAFFRFSGLDWDEFTWMHPDERFLIWVTSDIHSVSNIGDYFDTATSTLNPNNRGHNFYVYGTFPIFLTRYIAEWSAENVGWQEIANIGRPLSALFDLLTVLLVYLTAARAYDRRVAIFAAAFLSAAVLPIQLSHFFKEDTFLNFFTLLAIYFAVRIATQGRELIQKVDGQPTNRLFDWRREWPLYVGFGLALGLAVSSKLNAAPVAFVLPIAVFIRYSALSPEEKNKNLFVVLGLLSLGAVVSFITFRIFQPYAFSGPGFLGIKPNQLWIDDIREQRSQAAGDVDFPPSMQWARRPIWFGMQNIMLWGFGLPASIFAGIGFLWVAWRMLRGEWRTHFLLWSWTAFYFVWQSVQFNPTMRYFLPIYPMLAIYAGWAVVKLWDVGKQRVSSSSGNVPDGMAKIARLAAVVFGIAAVILSYGYAGAFYQVHNNPFTRAEASRWIFDNIPGPINLPIQTSSGLINQIISYPYEFVLRPDLPYFTSFAPLATGKVEEVVLHRVIDQYQLSDERSLFIRVYDSLENPEPLLTGGMTLTVPASGESAFDLSITLDREQTFFSGQTYTLLFDLGPGQPAVQLQGTFNLLFEAGGELIIQEVDLAPQLIEPVAPVAMQFQPPVSGVLKEASFSGTVLPSDVPSPQKLIVTFSSSPDLSLPLASGSIVSDFAESAGSAGTGYSIRLDRPLDLVKDEQVYLAISLEGEENSGVLLQGAAIANEGDWDDGLPLRMEGYDPFGGIYPNDLNFNMYWDDNPEKLERFKRILNQAEYVVISSSRQWGSLPRLPERFPLVTEYYRNLIGCPTEKTIEWCFNVAQPGMFEGTLGFDLVQTFQTNPNLGGLEINDQFSEEAFTVYDHPKVFVFRKNAVYDPDQTAQILDAVDLNHVIRVTPKRASDHPMDLMLPEDRLVEQQAGGTWSELFPSDGLLGRFLILDIFVWYFVVFLLGLASFPIIRIVMPGLADRGYAISRMAGLLILAYGSWLPGSLQVPVTRLLITLVFLGILLAGGLVGFRQKKEILQYLRTQRNYILVIEALALITFVAFLWVRWANPDLWHPWKGGEKPMDFSYFNAVLKSTSFPPFDPWFAGGYINYYYYGFVLMGLPVKMIGIQPAVAYNLILPTIFMLILLGAFGLGYNLFNPPQKRSVDPPDQPGKARLSFLTELNQNRGYLVGLVATLLIGLFGNLGSLRMIIRGYQMVGGPGTLDGASLLERMWWGLQGFFKVLSGANMPYGVADWYWIPSRVISSLGDVEPITEFPYFTLVYADMHAHLIALPVTLFALAWGLSVIHSRLHWGSLLKALFGFFIGGLAIGALRPINTWDLPTYLLLGVLAVCYAAWKKEPTGIDSHLNSLPNATSRFIYAGLGSILLVVLSIGLYYPYAYWYGQGYNSVEFWQGPRTPLFDYFTHWGVFFFLIFSWLVYETVDWMANTPASALKKLQPYRDLIWAGVVGLVLMVILLGIKVPGLEDIPIGKGVHVAWVALPMAAWAAILLLRPAQTDQKRIILFLIGSGFFLTIVVEVVRLVGDIGRMNTVFKFYYQVWVLFGISAAASLGWIIDSVKLWRPTFRNLWATGLALLLLGAALYPLLATTAKIKDRMAPEAPRTLDGLLYMNYARFFDQNLDMDLAQDYQAIRWMQENIQGSPVILEGNTPEYRWGSRFTINTGLPGVVGWNWHQRQQRGTVTPADWVTDRIGDIALFYTSIDPEIAANLLEKFNVSFFVVGQLENAYYPGPGLDKFAAFDGQFWQKVFQNQETTIYRVLNRENASGLE